MTLKYLKKRILLMGVTFLGITLLCFFLVHLAPGSPIDHLMQGLRGDVGVSQEVVDSLRAQYGFDKPLLHRYFIWLKNILTLDFGDSFVFYEPALNVILSKFPVSVQFGLVSLFFTYLLCIPLGIYKAVHKGQWFDRLSTGMLFLMYSVPPVMLGVFLVVFFAGGSFLDWFPMGGIASDNYDSLGFWGRVWDRAHHFFLPVVCYMIGNFTILTVLTKNSFLEELDADYVRTAWAKGLDRNSVYYKHVLKNAVIPLVTGFGNFLGFFLSGSIVIETIFSLDGIGLLMFQSLMSRDYNVIMGLLFLGAVASLLGRLLSDALYVVVDPRIDFS